MELLLEHFWKHAKRMGHETLDDYVAGANRLFSGNDVETVTRPRGDTVYYRASTNEFGVRSASGVTRTYLSPDEGLLYWLKNRRP